MLIQTPREVLSHVLSLHLLVFMFIPLGVLILLHITHSAFKTYMDAAADLFAFFLALDMTLVIDHSAVARVSAYVQPYYNEVFGLWWLASAILMAYSVDVQGAVQKYNSSKKNRFYPLGRVAVCWFFAVFGISFHLFALLD